jgi:hypothetical protein
VDSSTVIMAELRCIQDRKPAMTAGVHFASFPQGRGEGKNADAAGEIFASGIGVFCRRERSKPNLQNAKTFTRKYCRVLCFVLSCN